MSTTVSRRQTLAGVAVTAAAAMVPGGALAASNDLDELLDEQLLVDALALHRRMKAAMRSWRLAMGYTQDEVAELLEMSARAYVELEENPPEAGDFRDSGEVSNGVPGHGLVRRDDAARASVDARLCGHSFGRSTR